MTHTHRNTHTNTVRSRSEVRAWHSKLVWVPEMSGSWLHRFRLLLPLPIPSIRPTFHSQQQCFARGVTISHNSLTMLYCPYMLILVVKASDFRQKLTKGLWCCSNSSFPPCSTDSAIRHFPAVSCGSLLANSTKISIHEASYTSLLVCSLLCSHHKFGSRNSNFQWFKNFLFCDCVHVCLHVCTYVGYKHEVICVCLHLSNLLIHAAHKNLQVNLEFP